jgi:hypothetical protein
MATTSVLLTTSAANVYANGSTSEVAITWLSITNYSASSNATANVHVVPSGGSANVQNQIFANLEFAPGDSYQIYVGNEKLILSNNESVQALANANTILNAVVSYTSV